MTTNIPKLKYANAIISLLKGIVYKENDKVWKNISEHEKEIKRYFAQIGINCIINSTEGYSFLKQFQQDEDENQAEKIPALLGKSQLGFYSSLMCVLLRKRILEMEKSGEENRLILDKFEIYEMTKIFLPENLNDDEKKQKERINKTLTELENNGFIRKMKTDNNKIEVRKILKEFITADTAIALLQKYKEYLLSLGNKIVFEE